MANFKRAKTKRRVRCTICTSHRWKGNHTGRFHHKDEFLKKEYARSQRQKDLMSKKGLKPLDIDASVNVYDEIVEHAKSNRETAETG